MGDQPATQIEGEDEQVVHATWSRSGRNLILTVAKDAGFSASQQVLLSPEQATELADFMRQQP